MLGSSSGVLVAATAFALASGGVISALLAWWSGGARPRRSAEPGGAVAAFLFEDGRLADATPPARRLLRALDRRPGDLQALLALLGDRFGPDLGPRLAALPEGDRLSLPGPGAEELLEAEREDGALRLALHLEGAEHAHDRLAREAAEAEVLRLRALADDAPGPIWMLDGTGGLVWANRAYLALADLARAGGPGGAAPGGWNPQPLFAPPAGLAEGQVERQRLSLPLPGRAEPEWLEVTSVRRGEGSVHFATDAGRLVTAEAMHGAFVQTLSRTFAQLAIGLAVFDRQRRLALFNPAFADLTGLGSAFLSGRPLVHTVLDRLREAQVAPERRDYASWRDEMAALEATAASGHYCETWTQPDGRTYRVTGRPHPDGALGFTVEDITDEIAFARRAHAELDTARAVLDALGEAVAVFSPAGTLSLSNAAYDALWSGSPLPPDRMRLEESGLRGEVARWERMGGPSPLWEALRDGRPSERSTPVPGPGGRRLLARVTRLPTGSLAVSFARDPAPAPADGPPEAESPRVEEPRRARAAR